LSVNPAIGAPGRGGGEGVRIRDHLANVRTFLAWLRAGLVLLALGYALAKFTVIERHSAQYAGVFAAAAGWLVVVGAGIGFFRQRRAIESAVYVPRTWWNVILVVVAALGGGAILVYLMRS
jgi:putative membrane protein